MSDEFRDKVKTIGVITGGHKDKTVTETTGPDGERLKHTTEGDPVNGSVTHTEHADSDRVDATVNPTTIHIGMTVHQEG